MTCTAIRCHPRNTAWAGLQTRRKRQGRGPLLSWKDTGDEEYGAFSSYLAANGCTLETWENKDGVLTCAVRKEETGMTVLYDRGGKTLSVLYPEGSRPEEEAGTAGSEDAGILPTLSLAYAVMPNMETALRRYAASTGTLEDGSVQKTFVGIGEAGFNACSEYLAAEGCTVKESSREGKALTFVLEKEGNVFSFAYDRGTKTVVVTYPENTEVEKYMPRTGESFFYGRYEQDNDELNGQEPIEWLVLDEQDGKVLLLSKYLLDAKPYNTEIGEVTWETCSLRGWLNGEFLNAAFSETEQKAIPETETDNSDAQCSSKWSTSGGENTRDKVYLLSYGEAKKYLGVTQENGSVKMRASATAYAEAQGASPHKDYKTTEEKYAIMWWLRSPGSNQSYAGYAADISSGSSLDYSYVSYDSGCVRPALWIDLESDLF